MTSPRVSSRRGSSRRGSSRRVSSRRVSPRIAAFALLLAGGGLAVVAAAQPWWRAVGGDRPGAGGAAGAETSVSVVFSGVQTTAGLSQALAVVALVGTLLILVLRARGRRVIGVLLALVGAGIAVVGAIRQRPSADAVRTEIREVSLADQFALDPTGWPWIYAAAGALVLAGALLTVVTAARWTVRADRFERREAVRPVTAGDEAADVWKAMDAGLDPTLADSAEAGSGDLDRRAIDPDVHKGVPAVTMAETERDRRSAWTEADRPPPSSLE